MQKAKLSWLFIINIFLLITAVISLAKPNLVQSATAGHVVISEVQVGITGAATNEFIELYNPTASAVDIAGWEITKKTAAADPATDQVSLAVMPAGASIPAHGYYLVAHDGYTGAVAENATYSTEALAASNTIYLKNASDVVVDKLGLGDSNDFEGAAKTNGPATGSVERKANPDSTTSTMNTGGVDATSGNGEDSDNNSLDFVNRAASDPQNTSSTSEGSGSTPAPSASASPSASATPAPSASPSASASASPSATPTPSASPSASPSATPTPSASASPSATPTASPSMSPSSSPSATPNPTPSASPSMSPSSSPSATPAPSASASPSASVTPAPSASASVTPAPSKTPKPTSTPKPRKTLVCKFEPQTLKFGRFEFTFHVFSCDWVVR